MSTGYEALTSSIPPGHRAVRSGVHVLGGLFLGPAALIVWLACAAVILLQCFLIPAQLGLYSIPLVLFGWAGLCLLTIAIHELGHVVAARYVCWRVLGVCIGPLLFVKQGGKFSFQRNKNRGSPPGYVIPHPADAERFFWDLSVFAAGGVAANAITALISLLLLGAYVLLSPECAIRLSNETTSGQLMWLSCYLPTAPLVAILLVNVFFVVANLIPAQFDKFPSDGQQLIDAFIFRDLGISLPAIPRPGLGGILFHGLRPREWNLAIVERQQQPDGTPGAVAKRSLYGYYHALDQGNVGVARQRLMDALLGAEEIPGFDRSAIYLEAAYFEGFHRRNPTEARMWLQKVHEVELSEYTFLRGAAAVLLAEGLIPNASSSAQAALKKAAKSTDFGAVKAEREWLNAIVEACRGHVNKRITRKRK